MLSIAITSLQARPWRPGQIPNGGVFSCANCHINPAGGGPRNPFGRAVEQLVTPGSTAAFWSPTLAAQDSDGDGFTNGQELGDPEGDGVPVPGALVTNPGVASSRPPSNSAPRFTSAPLTNAIIGLVYEYQATAQDADGDPLSFSKVAGPDWLNVSSGGLVRGTPPEGAAGVVTVRLRVQDSKAPPATDDQTFTLVVQASFAGWQQLRFDLPLEQALAAPEADPDADGFPNVVEYARRTDPRTPDATSFPLVGFDASDQLSVVLVIRDDDPGLEVEVEFAGELDFRTPERVEGRPLQANPGAGFQGLEFVDAVRRASVTQRFARIRFSLKP